MWLHGSYEEKETEIFYLHTCKLYNIKTIIRKIHFIDFISNELMFCITCYAERKT